MVQKWMKKIDKEKLMLWIEKKLIKNYIEIII